MNLYWIAGLAFVLCEKTVPAGHSGKLASDLGGRKADSVGRSYKD
jgi:hypothetical protein